jgi:hypothetical protein
LAYEFGNKYNYIYARTRRDYSFILFKIIKHGVLRKVEPWHKRDELQISRDMGPSCEAHDLPSRERVGGTNSVWLGRSSGLKWTERSNSFRTRSWPWTVPYLIMVRFNGESVLLSSKNGPCGPINRTGPWTEPQFFVLFDF